WRLFAAPTIQRLSMTQPAAPVRTRFAPSPTGYLHLGGARTALFSWAFARHHKGTFVLRVEDTDLERSTPEAVQAILDGMAWLEMTPDEGPFYQMQRMDRYREVLAELLEKGHAYHCYCTPEEVEAMREKARALGLKPRYDGTWRPEPGKTLPSVPAGRQPVVRFRNPQEGATGWNDLVKGPISFDNAELDDLIIARPDGTPTYNFCVVVDDWDMRITHVVRGDDHVNNTPRQINILRALGAEIPVYGHVPMILGPDGEKLSKRHGAVSVMEYDKAGYLPEAMINYLARLGWSHGNDELFSRSDLVEWFGAGSLSKSSAQREPKKFKCSKENSIKQMSDIDVARRVAPRIAALGGDPAAVDLAAVMALLKGRAETLNELADGAMLFCAPYQAADSALVEQHIDDDARRLLGDFAEQSQALPEWDNDSIDAVIKALLATHGVKMPKLGIPLRIAVTGRKQTPSITHVLAILGREQVLERLAAYQGKR